MSGIIIPRPSLINTFHGLSGARVMYVCAPAGYGKTVAVRQWLLQAGGRSAVMTLDEYDNELAHFCVWFCSALQKCQPENTTLGEITAHPAFDTAPLQFTVRALAALTGCERTHFVIDDLHFVHNEEVLRLILSCIKHLPDHFQIILISRNEPPPGFSELLVKGQLACVTAEHLRFRREDILTLYRHNGIPLTVEQADDIYRFTDGWAIGVGAVLLSGGQGDGESLRHLDEFIRTHIWLRWDEKTRAFLLKTSVVQEFTPLLCSALTGIKESGEWLERLMRQNVFISCPVPGVYCYHRLFREFLQSELSREGEEQSKALLEKAGYWYLSEGDFYSAIECFIRCESHKGIIKSFLFFAVIDRSSFIVDKMLPILNEPVIHATAEKFSYIYSAMAWAAFVEGRAADCAEYADKYYKKQLSSLRYDPRLAFYILYMRIVDYRVTLGDILKIIEKIPKAIVTATASGAVPSIGIINQYMPLLHRGTRDFSECANGDVERNVEELLRAIGRLFGDEAKLLAESVKAGLLLEQGRLDAAYTHALAASAEMKEHFAAETKFVAMTILAHVLNALEQHKQKEGVLHSIGDMIESDKAYCLQYNFHAFSTRFRLERGDMNAARSWLDDNRLSLNDRVDFYRIYGHFTTCGAYIVIGEYDAAIIILSKLLELASAYNRPADMMEARTMLAIACWKKKNAFQNEALKHLEQAVMIAHRYGYAQIFVTFGAELSGMLHRLQNRLVQQDGGNASLAGFVKILYMKAAERTGDSLTSNQPEKIIRFTDKQKAIMGLLCEGKSYREMVEALCIKRPTLRSHLSLIYKKLDVTNEVDAIRKIMAQRLLDDRQ